MAKQSPEEALAHVNELYNKGNQARWMYMANWFLCFHFYVGNQYVYWAGTKETGEWKSVPNVEGEIRFVSNKVLPATRMLIGRMLQDQQQQLVIQASNDEKDMDAAKAATRFLDYEWRRLHGDDVHKEVCTWSAITGMGITKTYIDDSRGPKKKTSSYRDGEICQDIISPFEFIVPPNMRDWSKLPWVIHARMETKEWVENEFGVTVEGQQQGDEWAIYQAAVSNVTTEGTFFGSTTQFASDTVLVKELWVRPCKKWPKGRVLIIAGNQVVHDDDIPYSPDYWPFNYMPFFDVPFRFWPMGVIEPMIDPQKAINNTESSIQENIRFMGNGIVLAPTGSIEPDTMVAKPGAFWEYNPAFGVAPAIIAPNPVPGEVFTERQNLISDIYEMAGQHMMAGNMGGIRAAAAIMLFQQQDETEFLPIKKNVEAYLKRDAEIKLQLARTFTVPRKIKILGEEGQWMVTEFDASALNDDIEVEIQSKQEFANDKMTRFNQILQMMQARDENGKPLLDREGALRLLDMAGLDGATTEYDLDANKAKWENEQMLGGTAVEVNDFDDHAVHIRNHNMERKRIDFEKLPQSVQDAFAQHVLAHQQMLQAQSPQQASAKGDEQSAPMQQGLPMPQMPQMQMPQQQNPMGMPPGAFHMPHMLDGGDQLQQSMQGVHQFLR